MVPPHPEFDWLAGHGPLGEIFCVSFVKDLSPREVLDRLGVDESTIRETGFGELDELAMEGAEETGGQDAGWVGAVRLGDWTALVEPWGWRVPVRRGVLGRLSEGTEVVSVSRHDHAFDTFVYGVDRDVMLRFEPVAPQYAEGVDAGRWETAMAEVGLRREDDGSRSESPITSAFALARWITGVALTSDVLERSFLVAVADQE